VCAAAAADVLPTAGLLPTTLPAANRAVRAVLRAGAARDDPRGHERVPGVHLELHAAVRAAV
jgi:N-acetylglucosamine-6-phosphate deacetylase